MTKILFFVIVIFILWFLIDGIIKSKSSKQNTEYKHHETRKPVHRFSNDELLSPELKDVRIKEEQQKILDRRRYNKTIDKAEKIVAARVEKVYRKK